MGRELPFQDASRASFSPDGTELVLLASGPDPRVSRFHAGTGKLIASISLAALPETPTVRASGLAFAAGSGVLVAVVPYRGVAVIDLECNQVVSVPSPPATTTASLSRTAAFLLLGDAGGRGWRVDLTAQHGKDLPRLTATSPRLVWEPSRPTPVAALAISRDDSSYAVVWDAGQVRTADCLSTADGDARVFSLPVGPVASLSVGAKQVFAVGRQGWVLQLRHNPLQPTLHTIRTKSEWFLASAQHASGPGLFVSGTAGGLFYLNEKEPLRKVGDLDEAVVALAEVSSASERVFLCLASFRGTLTELAVHDYKGQKLNKQETLAELDREVQIGSAAVASDGRSVVLARGGRTPASSLVLLSRESCDSDDAWTFALLGASAPVEVCAVSSDSRWAAAADANGRILLWDLSKKTVARTLGDHAASVNCIAFSPDGAELAAGGDDQRVSIWRVGDSAIGTSLRGPLAGVTAVAFSDDGAHLWAGLRNGGCFKWTRE